LPAESITTSYDPDTLFQCLLSGGRVSFLPRIAYRQIAIPAIKKPSHTSKLCDPGRGRAPEAVPTEPLAEDPDLGAARNLFRGTPDVAASESRTGAGTSTRAGDDDRHADAVLGQDEGGGGPSAGDPPELPDLDSGSGSGSRASEAPEQVAIRRTGRARPRTRRADGPRPGEVPRTAPPRAPPRPASRTF
jgi:hypothetical protein